ncbi:MAG: proton-dependent oligopeptide transporter, family [Pseudomonadota bacterium]|nr:proton-dependent oligopeptide transporter, family [Pseudomonadota bacterium]
MLKNSSQPKGFAVFFLTEMWERYGFYIINTVLVFYLLAYLHLDDANTIVIAGSFTALAYLNSIFGGLIADKFIGYNRALIIGGVLLFLGYMALGSVSDLKLIFLALSAITVGTGMLKPNVSSMLSILYAPNDQRKDSGYTLYYVGIYVGATSGGLSGGYLKNWFGWDVCFLSAGIGMLICLFTFIYGASKYKLKDKRHGHIMPIQMVKSILSVVALLAISYNVLQSEYLGVLYFILVALFCFGFILFHIIRHHGVQRSKLIAFLLLIILSILYWAIYFQQFFSINLCTERATDITVPASSVSTVESIGVIIFGPFINTVWRKYSHVSVATKFSLSFLFNSVCFLLLSGGLWYAYTTGHYLSAWFIVIAYLLVSVGELCISPTSLSMVPSLVPKHLTSAMMGISLLSIGLGGKLAGVLASIAVISDTKASLGSIKYTYMISFFDYFIVSILTFTVAIILRKYINRLIPKDNQSATV